MLRASNDENQRGSKEDISSHIPNRHAALVYTSRHNRQTNKPSEIPSTAKNVVKSTGSCYTKQCTSKIEGADLAGPSNHQKQGGSKHVDTCTSARIKSLEDEASARTSEIKELKQRLQKSDLQMAEVVAQSAILVRDVQCAASKELADALCRVHMLADQLEESGKRFSDLNKGLGSSPNLGARIASPISKMASSNDKVLHVRPTATAHELAQTEQELLECRVRLSATEKELQQVVGEKENLEAYLRSSVQTSLKLQDALVNQKIVMKLEQLATEERARNEAAVLVQSARNECKLMEKQLTDALLSKEEVEGLLRNCTQMLDLAQKELAAIKASAERQTHYVELLEHKKSQQLAVAIEQVESHKQKFEDLQIETFFKYLVLECVWEGALKYSKTIEDCKVYDQIEDLGSKTESKGKCFTDDTHTVLVRGEQSTPRAQVQRTLLQEEATPIKDVKHLFTPRSANLLQDRCRTTCISSPEKIGLMQKEATLIQNLIKSEYEVEILGDKVDEHRIVLLKVASLLDYISTSALSAHETRSLMRRIIEQLQKFEDDYPPFLLPALL